VVLISAVYCLWHNSVGFSWKNWLYTWWNCWFCGKHDWPTTDV